MQLTKAEEQVMQILWSMEEATVQDILQKFDTHKPARTTVATILSILENKQFVAHRTEGRVNVYRAEVSKDDYSKKQLFGFVKNYFDGSFSSMLSFFAKENRMDIQEVDQLFEETREALLREGKGVENKPL